MTKFSKILVVAAIAVTTGATANSAFAGCYDSYQPSYDSYQPSYDNSSYYGYDGSYSWDHHGFDHGRGRFEFRGHRRG